jgi:hypothetical protein
MQPSFSIFRPAILVTLTAIAAADGQPWKFSFDGNARTVVETYRNLYFDLSGDGDDGWVHQRVQAMLALEHENTFQVAAELSWGDMWGRQSELGPPDQDDGDLLQLFAQGRLALGEDSLLVKMGRQTLYYGSGRLLSRREGANQRLAHDAFLLSWQRGDDIKLDAFVAAPVETRPGLFDNTSHPDERFFWSIYAVIPSPWQDGSHTDLYYIGLSDDNSGFAPGGRELRHTLGFRWWDETGPWIRNTEAIFQFGKAGRRDIRAGAISLGIGRLMDDAPMRPTLMLRADAISGGGGDGALNTFHPLFQANNYFNEGGFISPSNLYNINPVLMLQPHPKVSVSMGVNFQWRFSADDAIYAPPLQPIGDPAPGVDRYLGTAFNAAVTWRISDSAEFALGFTHHEAGPSLTSVGGKDVDYFQTSLRIEF